MKTTEIHTLPVIKRIPSKLNCLLLILLIAAAINLSAQEKKIALLYPKNTLALPTENTTWLNDNFYRWELFLIQNKYNYEVIDDDDLEAGLPSKYGLLILPAVRSLNDEEISSIKEFMNDGNSVLSTWSMGVYGSEGKWKGWSELEQLFGLSFISEISQTEASRIHSIFGGTPLSSNIPPGFRLQVTTYDKPVEVKIISENTYPLGYWLNNEIPFEGKELPKRTTSAVYGNYGKGNFVWFGFEFSAVVAAKEHQKTANTLLNNVISWLTDNLITQIETWPGGSKSAAVLSCDVEFKFDFINNALDLLEEEELPAQFYVLTESIDLPSFERLKKNGDVGLHGDDHILFKWQDYATQYNRLSDGIGIIEKLMKKKPISFRPPETYYDDMTINVMEDLNVNVLSSDFIEDRAVPQFINERNQIMIMPKTGFDDYDIFQRLKIVNIQDQSQRYILDFMRTYEEGGVYSLNFHTQMQCRNNFINALRKPIEEIKSRNVWITTHDKVFDWWRKKDKIKINSIRTDDKKYIIEIENKGEEEVDDLVISFYKKDFDDLLKAQILLEGRNVDYFSDVNSKKLKISIPKIYSREIKRISIGSQ